MKAQIRSTEEQCGMLSRRIMELETENEKLTKFKNVRFLILIMKMSGYLIQDIIFVLMAESEMTS